MSSPEQDRAAHRRRLIKAAVGAPVVFTLPSGAALAAASISCVDKPAATEAFSTQPMQTFSSTPSDTWVRFKLDKYSIPVKTAGKKGGSAWTSVNGFKQGEQWYQVSADGSSAVPVIPGKAPTPVLNESYYGLVEYQDGSIMLALNQDNGVAAISQSCLLSIDPGAAQGMFLG
jgi:hypothetical protein